MNRKLTEVAIDENTTRWRVVIEDEPSEPDSERANVRQVGFMRDLADYPHLLVLGPHRFQTLTVAHDGHRWVATAAAVITAT